MGIKVSFIPAPSSLHHFPSRRGGRRSHVVRGDLSHVVGPCSKLPEHNAEWQAEASVAHGIPGGPSSPLAL